MHQLGKRTKQASHRMIRIYAEKPVTLTQALLEKSKAQKCKRIANLGHVSEQQHPPLPASHRHASIVIIIYAFAFAMFSATNILLIQESDVRKVILILREAVVKPIMVLPISDLEAPNHLKLEVDEPFPHRLL